MSEKKYYKVVRDYDLYWETVPSTKYKSACEPVSSAVEYIPNEWVYAPANTRLFVFDDVKEAVAFYKNASFPWSIWECEVTPGVLRGTGCSVFNMSYKTFWNIVEDNLTSKKKWDTGIISRARSTVDACLVKGVKLTKKID